jgi:hypothetical protein
VTVHRRIRRVGGALLAVGFVAAVWYANRPAPAPAAPTYGGHGVVDRAGYSSNGTLEHPSDRTSPRSSGSSTPGHGR